MHRGYPLSSCPTSEERDAESGNVNRLGVSIETLDFQGKFRDSEASEGSTVVSSQGASVVGSCDFLGTSQGSQGAPKGPQSSQDSQLTGSRPSRSRTRQKYSPKAATRIVHYHDPTSEERGVKSGNVGISMESLDFQGKLRDSEAFEGPNVVSSQGSSELGSCDILGRSQGSQGAQTEPLSSQDSQVAGSRSSRSRT